MTDKQLRTLLRTADPPIPHRRVAGHVYVLARDLERFIASTPIAADTPAPPSVVDAEPQDVDSVLAALGKKRRAS